MEKILAADSTPLPCGPPINQQKNAALTEVKNQVGSLVVEVAEKVLRRELTNKAEQETYIKQLADGVKLN